VGAGCRYSTHAIIGVRGSRPSAEKARKTGRCTLGAPLQSHGSGEIMYLEYFGLHIAPFQLSPDPRFFYPSSVHRRALAHLKYGLSQHEGFIVITGEVGAGKTTLVQHLLASLDSTRYLSANLVSTQIEADDLVRMVAGALGMARIDLDKASVLRGIEDTLVARLRDGQRCLLMVDEAQNLSHRALEELRMLSNFQFNNIPLVQSFLLGQP
jgi:general secretion pathway protein A